MRAHARAQDAFEVESAIPLPPPRPGVRGGREGGLPQNYRDVSHEKLFSGQLPTRLVVGLVNNRAFNGHLERNPFNFKHYNLSEIALYLDGQQQFALKPIQPDYANGLYIRAYESLSSRLM